MRLFLAITPPPEILENVAAVQAQARAQLSFRGLRWERPEKWHITMQFLGSLEESLVPSLCAALAETRHPPPFRAILAGPGAFPTMRRPRVLWLGLGGELAALHLLHDGIVAATSTFVSHAETRKFTPHLTLARIQQPLRKPEIKAIEAWAQSVQPPSTSWIVQEFELWQSTLGSGGSAYTLVQSFPLSRHA
ncbi:MAG: RNA 2',3'-cyclic phosphodiesterase [Chthoniobacteraceae bacterium]